MNTVASHVTRILTRPSQTAAMAAAMQQRRGIRVKVYNGNIEQALTIMQRKMQASGIESILKRTEPHHIKNSEKRVLARKALERKVQSQDLARKLKAILTNKVRGL